MAEDILDRIEELNEELREIVQEAATWYEEYRYKIANRDIKLDESHAAAFLAGYELNKTNKTGD